MEVKTSVQKLASHYHSLMALIGNRNMTKIIVSSLKSYLRFLGINFYTRPNNFERHILSKTTYL